VAATLPLTVSENDEMRWKSITGYNEAQTAERRVASRNGSVQTGIDVLEAHNFDPIRAPAGKKKIGLLTNQTGIDSQGRRTIDVLAAAQGVSLEAIFSPEHGVTGTLDTTDIGNSRDAVTGVPVYSVYGATNAARRPSPDRQALETAARLIEAASFPLIFAGNGVIRGRASGELPHRPTEGLQVFVDVEHLVAADRSLAGGLGQTIGMLCLFQQKDGDEADAAIGAGHLNRAVSVRFIQQLHLAVGERLRAGQAFVVLGALLDEGDQVH